MIDFIRLIRAASPPSDPRISSSFMQNQFSHRHRSALVQQRNRLEGSCRLHAENQTRALSRHDVAHPEPGTARRRTRFPTISGTTPMRDESSERVSGRQPGDVGNTAAPGSGLRGVAHLSDPLPRANGFGPVTARDSRASPICHDRTALWPKFGDPYRRLGVGRHAEIAQRAFRDTREHRRGARARVVAFGRVEDDESRELRVIGGREPDERCDVVGFRVAAADRFLRRAGLAGDAIAGDLGALARYRARRRR